MQNHKALTLRANFSWTFVGNIVYAACQWGMLVLIAKLGNPEMVGQFTLGLTVATPVVMFTNLQLRDVQATDSKNQYCFGDYLALRLVSTGLALLIVTGIAFLSGYRWEISLVILLVGLAMSIEAISDIFYGLSQQYERMDHVAISKMIKGPLSLLMLAIGFYISNSVVGATVGLAVAWAIILFTYDIRSGALILGDSPPALGHEQTLSLKPRWHLATLKQLFWLALPLGFVMMLVSLYINIPRYLVDQYLGERQLGIFAAISYTMIAGNLVVMALGQSAISRLAKYYAEANISAFRGLLMKMAGIGVVLGVVSVLIAIVAGEQILGIIYGAEYAQHNDLFILLMIAAGIYHTALFVEEGIGAARLFRLKVPLSMTATATSAIACFYLIPSLGFQGAAIALILAATVRAILVVAGIIYAINKLHISKQETLN